MSDDANYLHVDDPVTLLLPDHVVMVKVAAASRTDFMVILSSRGAKTYESRWKLEEEGITWIRGYHMADSKEIDALRVACALSTKPDPMSMPPRKPKPVGHTAGQQFPIVSGGGGVNTKEMLRQLLEEQEKQNIYLDGLGDLEDDSEDGP